MLLDACVRPSLHSLLVSIRPEGWPPERWPPETTVSREDAYRSVGPPKRRTVRAKAGLPDHGMPDHGIP
jgi:hypothetical protein